MEEKWIAKRNGQSKGPWPKAALIKSAKKGHLVPTDLVQIDGDKDWLPISDVPWLHALVTSSQVTNKSPSTLLNGEHQPRANLPSITPTIAPVELASEEQTPPESPNSLTTAPEQIASPMGQLSATPSTFRVFSLASWLFTPFYRLLSSADEWLVYAARPFGVRVQSRFWRYTRLLGIYAVIYSFSWLPIPVFPLIGLAIGYIGVLAVGRAWVADEKKRTLYAKSLTNNLELDKMPDLRWTALVSALQLLVLFPLIFQQIEWHFGLYDVPAGTNLWDWSVFTLDSYNKALLNLFEAYGIRVHQITYNSPWGRHLTTLCRLTFDFILVQGGYRLYAIYETIRDAVDVRALENGNMISVRVGKRATSGLVAALCDENYQVRCNAAQALGELGDLRAVEALITRLRNDTSSVREKAVEALGKLGGQRAVDALATALRDDNTSSVREKAVEALGKLGGQQAVDALIDAVGKNSEMVRRKAASVLGNSGDPRAVEPLVIASYKDNNHLVRRNAVEALRVLEDPRAVELLVTALREDKEQLVRQRAAEALGELGDRRAVIPLIEALNDQAVWVRKDAAESLGKLGDPRAVAPLITALREDKEHLVRQCAAQVLGKLGDKSAVEPLENAAIEDEVKEVCNAARLALEMLSEHAYESVSRAAKAALVNLKEIEEHRNHLAARQSYRTNGERTSNQEINAAAGPSIRN